jgi:hypothetical protein
VIRVDDFPMDLGVQVKTEAPASPVLRQAA